ncbi:hypothetical protein AgCh_015592 [Apium graveolens]
MWIDHDENGLLRNIIEESQSSSPGFLPSRPDEGDIHSIQADSPSGNPDTSNSIPINNLEWFESTSKRAKGPKVGSEPDFKMKVKEQIKKRLIAQIGSRVPAPKRTGEFGLSVHRSGGSICSGVRYEFFNGTIQPDYIQLMQGELDMTTSISPLLFPAKLSWMLNREYQKWYIDYAKGLDTDVPYHDCIIAILAIGILWRNNRRKSRESFGTSMSTQ